MIIASDISGSQINILNLEKDICHFSSRSFKIFQDLQDELFAKGIFVPLNCALN